MADLSDLKYQAVTICEEAEALRAQLNIDAREEKFAEVERRAEDPHLWEDPGQRAAGDVGARRAGATSCSPGAGWLSLAEDTVVLAELAEEADDTDSMPEIERIWRRSAALLDAPADRSALRRSV